jgi:hypothetical protein
MLVDLLQAGATHWEVKRASIVIAERLEAIHHWDISIIAADALDNAYIIHRAFTEQRYSRCW